MERAAAAGGHAPEDADELECWLRNPRDELMRASGIHYGRGHFPISGSEEQERFR